MRPDLAGSGSTAISPDKGTPVSRAHHRSFRNGKESAYRRQALAHQIVFQEYFRSISEKHKRFKRLEAELRNQVCHWRLKPMAVTSQALRGIQFITAETMIAELGDVSRFDNPKQRMGYLGFTSSEYSSGRKAQVRLCKRYHSMIAREKARTRSS